VPVLATAIAMALVCCLAGIAWPILAWRHQPAEIDQATAGRLHALTSEAERNGWLVGSYNSKIYHRADCVHVKLISPRNQCVYKSSVEAAADGRVPCEYFESGRRKSIKTGRGG